MPDVCTHPVGGAAGPEAQPGPRRRCSRGRRPWPPSKAGLQCQSPRKTGPSQSSLSEIVTETEGARTWRVWQAGLWPVAPVEAAWRATASWLLTGGPRSCDEFSYSWFCQQKLAERPSCAGTCCSKSETERRQRVFRNLTDGQTGVSRRLPFAGTGTVKPFRAPGRSLVFTRRAAVGGQTGPMAGALSGARVHGGPWHQAQV